MEAADKSPDGAMCDRRLFVGGLHHDATELEVEKRFRPFGEVGCITLKTRRDETGHPTKTFAYVDLCATEGQLHKCVSVLNRSEWKSNLLQVELAKESFLQRLARERVNGDQSSKFKSALSESSKGSSQVLKSPQAAETPTFHRKEIVLGTDVSNTKRRFDSTGEQVTSSTQISVDPKWRQNAVDEGNRRRLEALEEHQRMAEARKKLVHAALHFKGRMTQHDPSHIIFDSSFEVDGDTQDDSVQLETSRKESRKVAEAGKLFDSEDDDDDDDEHFMGEDNNIRPGADYLNCFQVKPQFEGKKGQKLLELQARLASDPRFRLDSRFLEDEGKDDEDEEENVGMLVGTDQVESSKLVQQLPPSVCAASKRVFRDTSTLHFDPLHEGHAQFEVKHQVKKKRLDPCTDVKRLKEKPCHEDKTQTLPSVSAETFYNVSSDLKQLLTSEVGSRTVRILTDHLEEEGNKDDEEDDAVADEEEEGVVTEVLSHQDDHSCRSFKFSFFDTESMSNTRAEMDWTTSRVSKSAPSRSHLHNLHSSSSDDDCDDVQKLQGTNNGVAAVKSFSSRQTGMVTKPPFFFFANDPRLREGPDLFCRNAAPQRADGEWQELVVTLREHSQKRRREAIRHTRARPQ